MTKPKPERGDGGMPTPEEIDRAVMAQVLSTAIESCAADAAYLVWTSKRGRKTRIFRIHAGNLLAVHGLMRFVRDRIDEIEDRDKDGDDDDE